MGKTLKTSNQMEEGIRLFSLFFVVLFGCLIAQCAAKAFEIDSAKHNCLGEECVAPDILMENFAPLHGPKIAYGIMVYQREGTSAEKVYRQFQRLFEALYHPENTYTVHIDIKSHDTLLAAVDSYLSWFDNAENIYSVSVSWAGITVVERTLALMQTALEMNSEWRYFVNLGHEDYPIMNQNEMSSWLETQSDGTNFIKCWEIDGHDFFGQWEHHERRVEVISVDNFVGQTFDTDFRRDRDDIMGIKFYKSLQQTVLSRDFVHYASYGIEARRILIYLTNSKAPDELYFPTTLQSHPELAQTATCNDTRHFSHWVRPGGSWHPEYLEIEHLKLVMESGKFFIRKVDDRSIGLLDVLDELMADKKTAELTDLILSSVQSDESLYYVKDKTNADSIIAGLDEYRDLRDQHQIYHFKLWVNEQRRKHMKAKEELHAQQKQSILNNKESKLLEKTKEL
mmetsp:Transcript_32795/g.42108  ORF Transcript_32795/g.42108 Transcript_32795/m.42108 type:complete len:454 (-) Transcript_32795:403-1764(-)